MPGIPDKAHACLFGRDGVLTKTAKVHAAAWKEMFGRYLRERAQRLGGQFTPSGAVAGYEAYVDGKPRAGGVCSFVIGVDRLGQAEALRAHGADIVVSDLAELLDQP